VAEWRSGGVAEWRSGGVAEWRSGGVITGVHHRLPGNFQRQQLHRLDVSQTGWRNVPFDRIEDDRIEKGAPARIDAIAGQAVLGIEILGSPALRRNFADGVEAAADVLPIGADIVGAGKAAGHADKGNVSRRFIGVVRGHDDHLWILSP